MPYLEEQGEVTCEQLDCKARASTRTVPINTLRDRGWYIPWASEGEEAWCPEHGPIGQLQNAAKQAQAQVDREAVTTPTPWPVSEPPERAVPRDELDQALPVINDYPTIQPLVVKDIEARMTVGLARYGTLLQPHNGRDMLRDAYDEALDLVVYLRGCIYERDGE